MPYDLFISYSHLDYAKLKDIFILLTGMGIKPFFDKQDEPFPGSLAPHLEKGLDESSHLVFVHSKNTNSVWINWELEYFKRRFIDKNINPPIIRLLLDKTLHLPPAIGITLGEDIDLTSSMIDGISHLVFKSLRKGSPSGVIHYYQDNGKVPIEFWDTLLKNTQNTVRLMGHSMNGLLTNDRALGCLSQCLARLKKATTGGSGENGNKKSIRIILLTPNQQSLQQLQEIQSGMLHNIPLKIKIEEAIESIRKIKKEHSDFGIDSILKLKVTSRIMYSSTYICDSISLITNYTSIKENGKNSPTFVATAFEPVDSGLYSFYCDEFERYWSSGIHPIQASHNSDVTRIKHIVHKENIENAKNWLRNCGVGHLSAPSELIIYPTYYCSFNGVGNNSNSICPNCIYDEMRNQPQHLDWEILKQLLQTAIEMGVKHIQFSGGGEPLQYKEIAKSLSFLRYIKESNKNIELGLFTNGLHLTESYHDQIASAFTYVRISYCEGAFHNVNIHNAFCHNLTSFLRYLQNTTTPSVGLKFLLNRHNAPTLLNSILQIRNEILGIHLFERINHLRIKLMRSANSNEIVTKDQIADFQYNLYDCMFVHPDMFPLDTQVDLYDGKVSANYKCELAPLLAVVDPTGELLPCYNYLKQHNAIKIGNLGNNSIKELWGSQTHYKSISAIDADLVCNASNGCPCRFVNYQKELSKKQDSAISFLSERLCKLL